MGIILRGGGVGKKVIGEICFAKAVGKRPGMARQASEWCDANGEKGKKILEGWDVAFEGWNV